MDVVQEFKLLIWLFIYYVDAVHISRSVLSSLIATSELSVLYLCLLMLNSRISLHDEKAQTNNVIMAQTASRC